MAERAEILSEAEVDFLLQAAGDDPAPPTPDGGGDQTVTMRGDLEQINLADIFQTLAMAKMEGVLRVRNPIEERQIHCRDGYVRVHVPARLATRRLGQRLVRAGLVQADQLRTALIEQGKEKKSIGQTLVDRGLVTQEALDDIVGTQIAEDLFALFTWRHGAFEFWKGEPTPEVRRVFAACPEFEVNSLLLEVARRSDEWESILGAIGSLDEVPVCVAEPAEDAEPSELEQELLPGIDGTTTYRELADHTIYSLFEVARAARDLVRKGCLANLDETAMVEVANNLATTGHHKRALMLLQTLRDRPGDRPIAVLQGMASAFERACERRLAGSLLLEAAQRHPEPQSALELARAARTLSPHDACTLSFLRNVIVAHAPSQSDELQKVTFELLDALIESDLAPSALEIIEDARRAGDVQPAILLREVRARQKSRDTDGAARVLEELARRYDELGERQLATEAYDSLLRLDRSRKDVQKLLASRRRTRLARIVRIAAAATTAVMLATVGLVVWHQQSLTAAVETADREITAMLEAGNRDGARERLEHWTAAIGACEAIEDFQSRIAFAEATETGRQAKLLRARVNARLTVAAEHLNRGELAASTAVYEELAGEPRVAAEIREVASARLDALLAAITAAAKALDARGAPDPATLLDRRDLVANQNELHAQCSPVLLRQYTELDELARTSRLSALWSAEQHDRIRAVLADARETFARGRQLHVAYEEALQRNDLQRQLDPLFKAAVERERAHDFATALAHYRELERQPATDGDLRAHFRDRVARNATIVRLLEALRAATAAGDHATAHQQLRALRLSFPEVPFDRLAHLPLRVDSRPAGAIVRCNGQEVGTTPMVLPRLPADELRLAVAAPGFRASETVVTGDEPSAWTAFLTLPPARTWNHGSPVEVVPARVARGLVLVDRGGDVSLRRDDGANGWTFRSHDLSGFLTRPRVVGDTVLVGSLDGELRALALDTGAVRWSMPDLSTETSPVLVDRTLVLATTRDEIHAIDVDRRTTRSTAFPESVVALLHTHGNSVCVLGDRGRLLALDLATLQPIWQRELTATSSPQAAAGAGVVVVSDDRGHVVAVEAVGGAVRWQRDLAEEVMGAPAFAGDDVWITTRTALRRLDGATGAARAAVTAEGSDWNGGATAFGNRLVVPMRTDLQVLDRATGAPLYRITAGRRTRVHALDDVLLIAEADHTVQVFERLR